jgi:hypothetical protein
MSQPTNGVVGLSVAFRDTQGWHVKQMQKEGLAILNVTGESIDTAHVIVSYLFAETPAGDIDFGSGPRETVRVLLNEINETTDTPTPVPTNTDQALLFIAVSIPLTATIIVLVLILLRRKSEL